MYSIVQYPNLYFKDLRYESEEIQLNLTNKLLIITNYTVFFELN